MESVFIGNDQLPWALLSERYAEVSFLLSLHKEEPLTLFQEQGFYNAIHRTGPIYSSKDEADLWLQGLLLEGVDVLYVYGMGLGAHYLAIKPWLLEKKERVVVFLEEDLSIMKSVFSLPVGEDFLQNQ